jgi:hypothetical protein
MSHNEEMKDIKNSTNRLQLRLSCELVACVLSILLRMSHIVRILVLSSLRSPG